ncbi:MAG: right-handed parallel beta-helix repeat-containing protein [Candidatus Bathyarchaeota archaeon]|nr:right-handed parallel beta-helix repeat-containing protein [Candidatus Bathyarchaeota archaeon]
MKKLVLLASVLALLSTTVIVVYIKPVVAQGIIYIMADGSIEGTTDIMTVDNVTYTFTNNIFNQSIIVERDNIVVDGAGYTLQGTGDFDSTGIDLTGRINLTLKNMKIEVFWSGIVLEGSSYTTIYGNNITNTTVDGIKLEGSSNNTIYGNNIKQNTNNYDDGIDLQDSSNNRIYGNNITNNYYGIFLPDSINNTISENVVTNNGIGIFLVGLHPSGNMVSKNKIAACGVGINIGSNGDTISENNITENLRGISCRFSNNCTISGNNITANEYFGIWLYQSSNNIVSENNITNNQGEGIELYKSFNNTISGNFIANNTEQGVYLLLSSDNVVSGNRIKNNGCAIWLGGESSGNFVYHNEFLNNGEQVHSSNATNVWDDGGGKGNYWSDYEDRYPNATELDGSGIWDTPYVIDENNQDNYPLVPAFSTWTATLLILMVLTVSIAIYKRRLPKPPSN